MVNHRHPHNFWVLIKNGGFARAAEGLNMAAQTISAQVPKLAKSLGHQLRMPSWRVQHHPLVTRVMAEARP